MHAISHPSQVVNCVEIYIDQLLRQQGFSDFFFPIMCKYLNSHSS